MKNVFEDFWFLKSQFSSLLAFSAAWEVRAQKLGGKILIEIHYIGNTLEQSYLAVLAHFVFLNVFGFVLQLSMPSPFSF